MGETERCLVPLSEYFVTAESKDSQKLATSQERRRMRSLGRLDLTVKKLLEFSKKKVTKGLPWWLRLCAPSAGCLGFIRGQGTKIVHAATKSWRGQINKNKYFFKVYYLIF